MKNRDIIITTFFIIASLFVYAIFPAKNDFQQIVILLFFFVLFPLIFNQLFLKRKLAFYGLRFGAWKMGLTWSLISLALVGFIFLILAKYFNFLGNYNVPVFVVNNLKGFLFYEFIMVLFFVIIYEFYFRGFVLAIYGEVFRDWAILIQAGLFLILFLSIKGSTLNTFLPYLIFTPLAGWITLKSRSLIYSLIAQFLIILVIDIVVVRMIS
jgi:membrane protease YdiL (CAAX protease family)